MASCAASGNGRGDAGVAGPTAPVLIPPSGVVPNAGGGGRGGRGGGPVVTAGTYKVVVTPAGGSALVADVKVEPDPHFKLSDADRKTRENAIMSAYRLQRQLETARDAAQTLGDQMAALRQYFIAAGDGGRTGLTAVDRVTVEVMGVQGQVDRAMAAAAAVQNAMDGYAGSPTAAQVRQVDWAWEDGTAAVSALNKLIQQDLPGLGGAIKLQEIKPVGALAR
jgi:hypothetical protein